MLLGTYAYTVTLTGTPPMLAVALPE